MYRQFMKDENYRFVQDAVAANTSLLTDGGESGFWVCYGSLVLNAQTRTSDIDLLYVGDYSSSPVRLDGSYQGTPMTIYSISRDSLKGEGTECLHGGYFAGKIFNPYVTFGASEEDDRELFAAAGGYIADFSSYISGRKVGQKVDSTQLAADSVLARLHICPWYISYFIRYFIRPDFPQLWDRMCQMVTKAMVESGKVVPCDEYYHYEVSMSEDEFTERVARNLARFWALGTALHGSDPNFPNTYIDKSKQYLESNSLTAKPEELIRFLRTCSETGRNV